MCCVELFIVGLTNTSLVNALGVKTGWVTFWDNAGVFVFRVRDRRWVTHTGIGSCTTAAVASGAAVWCARTIFTAILPPAAAYCLRLPCNV